MSQKIAKHRANDASNDVHRPPLCGDEMSWDKKSLFALILKSQRSWSWMIQKGSYNICHLERPANFYKLSTALIGEQALTLLNSINSLNGTAFDLRGWWIEIQCCLEKEMFVVKLQIHTKKKWFLVTNLHSCTSSEATSADPCHPHPW